MEDRQFREMPQHVQDEFEEREPKTLSELVEEYGPDYKIRMLEKKIKPRVDSIRRARRRMARS